MASSQHVPFFVIQSDSDSDGGSQAKSSQRATQPRKRSAAAAGHDSTTALHMKRCVECGSLCVVQTDPTPSNLGRNFINCDVCNDIQWISPESAAESISNSSAQHLLPRPSSDSDDDVVVTGTKPAPPRPSPPDVIFISSSQRPNAAKSRLQPLVPDPANNSAVSPANFVPSSVSHILAECERQRQDACCISPAKLSAPRTSGDCPICQDVMAHLASLGCGHVFCFSCIHNCLKEQGKQGNCPICRKKAAIKDIRRVFLP